MAPLLIVKKRTVSDSRFEKKKNENGEKSAAVNPN